MNNDLNNQQPQQPQQQPMQPMPPMGQPPMGQPPMAPAPNDGKGLSIAALVCGILGIIGGFIPVVTYFTFVLAVLGIVFGVIGRKKSVAAYGKASGIATAGLICGIVGTALGLIGIICLVACFASAGSILAEAGVDSSVFTIG